MTQISASSENPAERRSKTRIQKENETRILLAALEVFSENGFRGATLDRIAAVVAAHWPEAIAPGDLASPALTADVRRARAQLLAALDLTELG